MIYAIEVVGGGEAGLLGRSYREGCILGSGLAFGGY